MKLAHLLRSGAIAAVLFGVSLPALADMDIKDGNGTLKTVCTKTYGSTVHAYCHTIVDVTGVAFGTLANPFHTGLTFGGVDLTLGQKASAAGMPVTLSTEQQALLKALSDANGTSADPLYNGSNTATQIALLKAAVANLATIVGQAAPTYASTATVPAGTSLPRMVLDPGPSPQPVDTVIKGGGTDTGGIITTASTAQTFMVANATRRAWSVQNQSTGDLYVNCSSTATLDYHSLKVPAGALYESSTTHVGTGACSIIRATTGQAFYARQF